MSSSPVSDLRERVHRQLEPLYNAGGALAVGSPLDSARRFSLAGDGRRWSLERARLHRDLLRPYRSVPAGGRTTGRCAVATAGPPAAGKSSAIGRILGNTDGWRRIDADTFKELLVERALSSDFASYRRLFSRVLHDGHGVMPLELASLFHTESAVLARRAVDLCLRNGEDVIIEGTLQWEGLVADYSSALGHAGYTSLTVIDVATDLNVALERAKSRWWEGRLTGGNGGRFTPPRAIKSLYDRPGGGSRCSDNARDLVDATRRLGLTASLEVLAPESPPPAESGGLTA